MRVLIVKTSSMGDVIHTLPALTDAGNAIPGITFDWLVEENFAEVPGWHPLVKEIIPIALRRWKKQWRTKQTWLELRSVKERLKKQSYDLIIDAQGLLKSAIFTRWVKGKVSGGDWQSAREPIASLFYQHKCSVNPKQHAVTRMRSLFAQALGYTLPDTIADYGVDRASFFDSKAQQPYLVFLHGTTWVTKHWPEEYWIELAKLANEKQLQIKLPWGSEPEKERAERIAQVGSHIEILPKLKLIEIAKVLANAQAIVAVDTGLGHLAAVLSVPTISLYGPTDAVLTGAMGKNQYHLSAEFSCAPCLSRECSFQESASVSPACFQTLSPAKVWHSLLNIMNLK
jgi:heptosyltransferase-1